MAEASGGLAAVVEDKALEVYARFEARLRTKLRALISDELIAEHKAKPLGQHSDALERVLNYFRRAPVAGKYVIIAVRPHQEYAIGVLTGVRGLTPRILDEQRFNSEEEAEHGVFRQRVRDLMAG